MGEGEASPSKRLEKIIVLRYNDNKDIQMITDFFDQTTEDIFDGRNSKKTQKRLPAYLHATARRKLDMINAAYFLKDLEIPPNNRLEKLKGDRSHQHSIRINDQYRIVFTWIDGNAENVEIVDYH